MRLMFVRVSVAVTVTPGTFAPWASVTEPSRVPVTAWAQDALGDATIRTARIKAMTTTQYRVRPGPEAWAW